MSLPILSNFRWRNSVHNMSYLGSTKFFPTIVILIHLAAAFTYFRHGDLRRGLYWIFAACITASVTY